MEWSVMKTKIPDLIKKYKFAALVLLVGIALVLIPGKEDHVQQVIYEEPVNILTVEEQLAEILGLVRGAGKVKVMLNVLEGEQTLYQTDESNTASQESSSYKSSAVIVVDADRNEQGLIKQVNPPVYMGAVVVCQGADDPAVRLAVVEAVSKLTGLGADKISVLKMK